MTKKQKVFGTLALIVFVIGVITFTYSMFMSKSTFTPPVAELNAITGVPTVSDGIGYSEFNQESMPYTFHVCGIFNINGNKADIYFTNDDTNNTLLLLRVYNSSGVKIGETGFLKPGEYVQTVELSDIPSAGEEVKYEIVGYTPDTYHSAGNITLITTVNEVE
jgi:hypothetical protein